MDSPELGQRLGPHKLVILLLHAVEFHSQLRRVLLGLREKVGVRNAAGEDKVGNNGDEASEAPLEDEEVGPNKEAPGRCDLEHSIGEQSAKGRGNDGARVKDGNPRGNLNSGIE